MGLNVSPDKPHFNIRFDPQEMSFKGLFRRYQNTAKRRNIRWSLPIDVFKTTTQKPCIWCGVEPFEIYNIYLSKNKYTQRKYLTAHVANAWIKYNGLDRVRNSEPYTPDNISPCCKWCNFARNDRTEEEFLEWLRLVGTRYSRLEEIKQ